MHKINELYISIITANIDAYICVNKILTGLNSLPL